MCKFGFLVMRMHEVVVFFVCVCMEVYRWVDLHVLVWIWMCECMLISVWGLWRVCRLWWDDSEQMLMLKAKLLN